MIGSAAIVPTASPAAVGQEQTAVSDRFQVGSATMHYTRVGHFLSASRISGPKHNILQLELGPAAGGGPDVERLGPTDANPLSEAAVVAAVMEGLAAANQRFARNWTISRLRYAPADSGPEAVYAHLAFSILAAWEAGDYLSND